jgi:hypothetical protein
MSTFSNENHVTRGFTSDAINEFAFRLLDVSVSPEKKMCKKVQQTVGKPTSASVTPPIRLKTFTQGQIIITHQVPTIIVIGIDV